MNIQRKAAGAASPAVTADLVEAQRFLDTLDPKATSWTFQTFDDNADRKAKDLARVYHGTLDQHAGNLSDLQARGAGIFVTVNETDGQGRSKANITRARASYVDLDGSPLEPVTEWETPHIIVDSSPGRFHAYWLIDELDLDQFTPTQKALIEAFGADESVHDLPRVMRLPGFHHQKVDSRRGLIGSPYMVRMRDTGAFPAAFTAKQFLEKVAALKPAETFDFDAPLSVRAAPPAPNGLTIDTGHQRKTPDDIAALIRGMSIDGEKHAAVRDFAASMAARGTDETTARALVSIHCPVWDSNVDSLITSAFEKFRKAEDQAEAQAEASSDTDPVDLWGQFDPPDLPTGLIPRTLEDFARGQGERMGADPAGLAVAALVTCAAALPDKVVIKVKEHDTWTESARLWAALVGNPSTKKSPILTAATSPLRRLDVDMFKDWQREFNKWSEVKKSERTGPPPAQTRLRIEDATVEAAQEVLQGSPWGVMLYQDELSGFFGAMDKYGGNKAAQADRAFWLRSFNGGEYALNRVGRGASLIPNCSVCLLGGIQPEPIRKLANDAADDGLLQRLFPIVLRPATMGTDSPAPPVADRYRTLVEQLRHVAPPGWMGMAHVSFDREAQEIRRRLEAEHLGWTALESVNRKLSAHIGKYDGLFARLCLLWHCIEHVERYALNDAPDFDAPANLPETIGAATAQRVADFLHKFLMRHAMAFYSGILGMSDDHDRLTALAGFIVAHGKEEVTNRDVQRSVAAMRGLEERDTRRLFEQMAAFGWLHQTPGPRPTSPPRWIVNPSVHTKFAERAKREVSQRREVKDRLDAMRRN